MSSRKKVKKNVALATVHLVIIGIVLILQICLAVYLAEYLRGDVWWVSLLWYGLATLVGAYINLRHDNPSSKPFWILLIILFPAFGLLLYIIWGFPRRNKRKRRLIAESTRDAKTALSLFSNEKYGSLDLYNISELHDSNRISNLSYFMKNNGFPAFIHTDIQYFSSGESLFDDCLKKIADAKRSIFMSFFILKQGRLWDMFYPILLEKAKKGVEIRLIIDDAGTMFNLSREFIQNLQEKGIKVSVFNPTHRYLNTLYLNYRNHQKMILIDSTIGYTGGINLADEYANFISPYGYWKDTGVRLEGDGVFGLTVIFLDMWDQISENLRNEYLNYIPKASKKASGLCHVFSDGPANNPENPAEDMIFRFIETSRNYIYLTTPYLIISKAMTNTICRAAQSGVRVVLLVPFRLDHWYVFEVSRSYFPALIRAGVEIYRYSPGMLHAKMIVSDDSKAMVSTINLDNRSFYSQYEDGVWFCGCDAVTDVKNDIDKMIESSQRVTTDDWENLSIFRKILCVIFRLFAPLM